MVNIVICDDERAQIDCLASLARKWAQARGIIARISDFESAESLLFAYEDDKSADILLLDIQMKAMDGVALAKRLRDDNDTTQIIFVTGYPDYIAEGYEVSALHYLMKPVDEKKLFEVLDKAAELLKNAERTLLLQTNEAIQKIRLDEIVCVEAFAHCVAVQTKSDSYESRTGIGEMEKAVGYGFVRCHRSYIAGLSHVSRITKTEVFFDNGRRIPLSRRLYKEINLAFIEYHTGRKP